MIRLIVSAVLLVGVANHSILADSQSPLDGRKDYDPLPNSESVNELFAEESRSCTECYLICVSSARLSLVVSHTLEGKTIPEKPARMEWKIGCTVVASIKGEMRITDRLEFKRKAELQVENVPSLHGRLYYIMLRKDEDGEMTVDSQSPKAMWLYSEERAKLVDAYQSEGRDGAEQVEVGER